MKDLILFLVLNICGNCVLGTPSTISDYIDTIDVGSEEDTKPVDAVEARERVATCALPAVRGYCRALFVRWRYDPQAKKCFEFKYGGCGGNANNFLTKQDCRKYCEAPEKVCIDLSNIVIRNHLSHIMCRLLNDFSTFELIDRIGDNTSRQFIPQINPSVGQKVGQKDALAICKLLA